MAKMMVFIAEQNKNYMFRPISAIIRLADVGRNMWFLFCSAINTIILAIL